MLFIGSSRCEKVGSTTAQQRGHKTQVPEALEIESPRAAS